MVCVSSASHYGGRDGVDPPQFVPSIRLRNSLTPKNFVHVIDLFATWYIYVKAWFKAIPVYWDGCTIPMTPTCLGRWTAATRFKVTRNTTEFVEESYILPSLRRTSTVSRHLCSYSCMILKGTRDAQSEILSTCKEKDGNLGNEAETMRHYDVES